MPRFRILPAVLTVLGGLLLSAPAPAAGGEWRLCQGSGEARSSCSVSCNGESRRQSCGAGEMCECRCAPQPQCRCRAMDQETRRPDMPAGPGAGGHPPGRQG